LSNSSVLEDFLKSKNLNSIFTFTIAEWDNTTQKFYNSYQTTTDYGVCCVIVPYLDLVKSTDVGFSAQVFFVWGGGQQPIAPFLLLSPPFFLISLFLSTCYL
jgi:hypothetical protein